MEIDLLVMLVQGSLDWRHGMEDTVCLESCLTKEKHHHSAFVDAQMGEKEKLKGV